MTRRHAAPGCAFLTMALALLLALPAATYAARAWRAPLTLSAPGADAWVGKVVPSLAVTPTGDAVMAWSEHEGPNYEYTVKAAVKSNGGSTETTVLGGGSNPPSVAATVDGRGLIAWVGSPTAGAGGTGGTAGDQVLVSEHAAGKTGAPTVVGVGNGYGQPGTAVAANARGEVVVLFTTGNWSNQRLWSVRRTGEGVWEEPQPVTEPLGEAVWRLHAGMSETGEAVFAWYSWHPETGTSAWSTVAPAGEVAGPPRRLQAEGNEGAHPSLSVDPLGNAIIAWVDISPDESTFVGRVRAVVKAAATPFGEPIDLGGSAADVDGVHVGLSNDGHALVTWADMSPNGRNGASMNGVVAVAGLVPGGVFSAPEHVGYGLFGSPAGLAVDPVGNAALFLEDSDTAEPRVVRRSVAGLYGQPRNVVPCPRQGVYPLAAAVDPLGNASLLWAESNWLKPGSAVRLSQDEPSGDFSPDPCPAPPPPLTWLPKDPGPGATVTFDASGYRHPDAARTTFKWDLDGDGTFETDTEERPTASHVFGSPGEKRVGIQVSQFSQREGNSSISTSYYLIRVGTPPDPPNEYPAPKADPRPPDLPAEDPWPLAPEPEVPVEDPPGSTLPPLANLPGSPGGELPPAPAHRFPVPASQSSRLALTAPAMLRARQLDRDGVPVSLTAGRAMHIKLTLLAATGRGVRTAGRRLIGGPLSIRVRRGRPSVARVELNRYDSRLMRKQRLRALTLRAVPLGGGQPF